jgi:uncharacterized protein YcfJ
VGRRRGGTAHVRAYLGGPLIAGGGLAAGAVAGGILGAVVLGPVGATAAFLIGAGAGAYLGITLGHQFDLWYRSATTEERARPRSMA